MNRRIEFLAGICRRQTIVVLGLAAGLLSGAGAALGAQYICTDLSGDLETPSDFYLDWLGGEYLEIRFIENASNSGPLITTRIAYQDDRALVAIDPDFEGGLSTISLFKNDDGTVTTIRSYIDSTIGFVEKSRCEPRNQLR